MTDRRRRTEPTEPTEPAGSIFADPNATDPALRLLLARLRATSPAEAPEPSGELLAALAALRPDQLRPGQLRPGQLGAGDRLPVLPRHRHHRRTSRYHKAILLVAGTAAVAVPATGVAAANDGLPQPAEQVVSRVVNDWTPFSIATDAPAPRRPQHPIGATVPTASHSPSPRRTVESDDPSSPTGIEPSGTDPSGTEPTGNDSPSPRLSGSSRPTSSPRESEPTDDRSGASRPRTSPSPTPTASHAVDR